MMTNGMHYGWSSVSLPQLLGSSSHIPISDEDGSWIAVMILIGAVGGSVLAGVILDKLGRKKTILLASIPFFASWIMIAFAQSIHLLLIARFTAGISDGLVFCAIPTYLGEISDPRIRGFTGSTITVSLIFGMLLVNIIGSYLSIRNTALVSSVVPIIVLLSFWWMPESPYYLIMKGNSKQAEDSLKILKGTDDVKQNLNELIMVAQEEKSNSNRYWDLFTVRCNRKAFFVALGIRSAQIFTGATFIMFYAQTVFTEAANQLSPGTIAMVYFGVQVIVSGFSSVIVDKSGRKPLMIISIIGVILVLMAESCYFWVKSTSNVDTNSFAWISVIGLIVFVVIYSIGMQTIPLLLVGEVFATNVKAFAVSLADIFACLLAAVVGKLFQFTKDKFGLHVPFLVFAVLSFLHLIFIVFYVPETKGKTLEEIQTKFKSERKKKDDIEVIETLRSS